MLDVPVREVESEGGLGAIEAGQQPIVVATSVVISFAPFHGRQRSSTVHSTRVVIVCKDTCAVGTQSRTLDEGRVDLKPWQSVDPR